MVSENQELTENQDATEDEDMIKNQDTTDVLYEEEEFNEINIKAATIDKLIQHCLDKFGKFPS